MKFPEKIIAFGFVTFSKMYQGKKVQSYVNFLFKSADTGKKPIALFGRDFTKYSQLKMLSFQKNIKTLRNIGSYKPCGEKCRY